MINMAPMKNQFSSQSSVSPLDAYAQARQLKQTLANRLNGWTAAPDPAFYSCNMPTGASAVLFLLGRMPSTRGGRAEPSLILTRRSPQMRQSGDLCCPGGGIEPMRDRWLARLVSLPGLPLARWRLWRQWRKLHPRRDDCLPLLLAAALREAIEEMRLNPLGITFLGPLPPQPLVMFARTIYPLAAWAYVRPRFFPNWEIDKIVAAPLRALLDADRYRRLRIYDNHSPRKTWEMLCFCHFDGRDIDILWGATLRITVHFLTLAFGFQPPELSDLPVIERRLTPAYVNRGP